VTDPGEDKRRVLDLEGSISPADLEFMWRWVMEQGQREPEFVLQVPTQDGRIALWHLRGLPTGADLDEIIARSWPVKL